MRIISLIEIVVIDQSENRSYLKNIKNLAKFKNFKNSIKYKKLIKNLVKFKTPKELSFWSLAAKLVYTKLRQIY